MMSPTADAGRTPTHCNTPPIETCLGVIALSFVALTLLATPREGAAQPPPSSDSRVIVGSGVGGQSKVRVFDGETAQPLPGPLGSFTALTQNPGGEVRVAGCDFNRDGTDDIIVGPGVGKPPEVRVFDGFTGQPFSGPLGSFLAFNEGFLGGVYVVCGDLTGDSIPDIIAARASGKPPEVRVFNGMTAEPLDPPLGSFLAFNQNFLGGVYVACGDLTGDTIPDIIAARGGSAKPGGACIQRRDGCPAAAAARLLPRFQSEFPRWGPGRGL